MIKSTKQQATALVLAAVITLSVLASLDRLAIQQHGAVALAQSPVAEQVVVAGGH